MTKYNDTRLYLYGGIVLALLTLILAAVSYYSILMVEPRVENLLASKTNVNRDYKEAYIILRNPQIFAGYQHFDAEGYAVKRSLSHYDKLIYNNIEIDESSKRYLDILLERRKKGSRLGRSTAVFTLLLSLMSWLAFFFERRDVTS